MAWTNEQKEAIYTEGTNIIVSAGAGSGKTAVLTERVLEKVKKGISVDNLLILTFTKMAAKEMKERIGDKLKKEGLTSELAKLDTADITTFDAYALSVVKKYHYYLNVSKAINIIDGSVITLYKRKILKDIFEELYEENNHEFIDFIQEYCIKDDKDIFEFILNINSKLDLKTNKREYLDNYINTVYDEVKIDNDIDNYIKVILKLISNINDYLEYIDDDDYLAKLYDVLSPLLSAKSYDDIKSNISIKLPILRGASDITREYRDKIKSTIDEIKKLTTYDSYDDIKRGILSTKGNAKVIIDIIKKLDDITYNYKVKYNSYEYSDISALAIKLVRDNKEIREEIKNNLNEILIDEYQDTSDLQEIFISYFKNNNRFMVGDIKQSIYRFRNANPNIFKQKYENYYPITKDNYPSLQETFKNAPGYLIDMNQNFRSRAEVLLDINNMFSLLMTKEVGDAEYAKSHQMKFGLTVYNNQACSDEKGFSSDFIYYPYDKEKKIDRAYYEGYIIASDIKSKLGNYMVFNKDLKGFRPATYDDFCIILDRKDHFEIFKRVLEANNIPVVIYADSTVSDSYPAMVILNILHLISYHYLAKFTSDYYHALTSVLRSFICQKSDEEIFEIVSNRNLDNEISRNARSLSYLVDTTDCASILNKALEMFGFYSKIKLVSNINDALHAVEYISNKLGELAKMGYNFTKIVEELDILIKNGEDAKYSMDVSTSHGVKMMNIHKSKGLEYPICYFADFNHAYNKSNVKAGTGFDLKYGIYMPINDEGIDDTMIKALYKDTWVRETVSERLRLFYVALTRAREKMIFIRDITNSDDSKDTQSQSSFGQYFDYIEAKAPNIIKNRIDLTEDYFSGLDVKAIEGHFYSLGLKNNDEIKYESLNLDIKEIKNDHISKRMNKLSNKHLDTMLENGLNYHYILEMLDFKRPFESLNEMNIDLSSKKIIENVLKMDLMKNISHAKTLHEYEFSSIIENKAYHGIIDLLVIYDDYIDIIDYKLKNFDDEAYDRQLGLYKAYVKSKTNKPVKCHLLSIIDAKSREVEV